MKSDMMAATNDQLNTSAGRFSILVLTTPAVPSNANAMDTATKIFRKRTSRRLFAPSARVMLVAI